MIFLFVLESAYQDQVRWCMKELSDGCILLHKNKCVSSDYLGE